MKRWGWVFVVGVALLGCTRADAAGIAGSELGILLPTDHLGEFIDTGGAISPYVGYMWNGNIGFLCSAQLFGAENDTDARPNGGTTMAIGAFFGPRVALPLGPVELWSTGQGGVLTGLTDEHITDTSWGFSVGGGVNFLVDSNVAIGLVGRWNRQYQRVHRTGDVTYVTAGLNLMYRWGEKREYVPPPPPPPPPPAVSDAPPAPPPPLPTARRKIVLRGVNFDFDKSTIRPDARPVLDEAAATLKSEAGIAVISEGHTDSVGSDEYNQRLSVRRAEAVRNYLVGAGISPERIEIQGFGESRPVATNDTEEGRAQNRRVELRVK